MGERLRSDGVITVRPWRRADASALVDCLDGDEEITRWLDLIPQPYTVADALTFFGGPGETAFAVVDQESGRLLGGIGLRWSEDVAEIGYWARADARGRARRAFSCVPTSRTLRRGASQRRPASPQRVCCAACTGTRGSDDARAG